MSGRGRSREAKSPDHPDFTEKQKQKKKKEEQKNPSNAEEKPPLESTRREKTANHCTEVVVNKPQSKSTDSTPAKACATRTKTTKDSPKITKDDEKTSKTKACGTKPKLVQFPEQVAKNIRKTSEKITEDKICPFKANSPEELRKIPKTPPRKCEDITEDMTNHCTEVVNKHQGKSKDSTTAKTCSTRTKVIENPPVVKKKMSKDSPKITKKGSGRAKSQERLAKEETPTDTRKRKTSVKKAKSPEMLPGETPDTPKDPTEDDGETSKAKACGNKPKLVQFPEKNPDVDSILKKTLEKLKIKKNHRSEAASIINAIKQNIIKHLKEKTESFKEVQEPLPTGSYYENLKICNPDEFDIMVPILVDRVEIKPFGDDGAFYSVELKRDKNPLQKFKENEHLSASKMLSTFREEVKNCVVKFTEWEVEKKKRGCPAVTLTTNVTSVPISLDVVLCLMVKSSWPSFTKGGLKIDGWLGTKVKQEYKWKPYYLVPKYEGRGTEENNGVLNKDVWRVSFSHVEKAIMKNHGSEKTCCERDGTSCCRKSCLKLLKHLLQLLKERDSSFDKFCSYHVKTTLLHACCSRTKDSDWRLSDLSHCFQLLLEDFENYLNKGELQNFFIPSQNLLSGISVQVRNKLSRTLREERLKGFPIFKEQLQNAH